MRSNVPAGRIITFAVLLSLATIAAAQTSQTRTEVTKGEPTVTTSELKGEVDYVEGNTLVVRMASGAMRTFNVPESRRFIIDGKELTVHELVPGTKLTATVTRMLTPVTVQTITVKSGTVWHVMGNNVILTLPNGENRQFIVKDDTRFAVNGNPATVHDLAKGMVVYAEKVVEEPLTELTTNTRVVGEAPPPAVAAAAASTSVPASAPTPAAAQPTPVESTSAAPQGTPAESAPAPVTQAPATAEAPSRMPLIVGLLLVAVVLVVWMLSRRKA